MIYEQVSELEPIRQGDIFASIPRVDLALSQLEVIQDGEPVTTSWSEALNAISDSEDGVPVIALLKPVFAIVITQDCDGVRARDISLCEIRPFVDVEGLSRDTKQPKKWVSIITRQARINQKWFYLPPDEDLGFNERMGVDFQVTLRLARVDLESYIPQHRLGRLSTVALEHFRERLSEFYRRYPYDEWYPLNREEFEAYNEAANGDIEPFDWQK